MDETTAALLALRGEMGELKGEMKGIGREIGEIKDILEKTGAKCASCRREIDTTIETQGKELTTRIDKHETRILALENVNENKTVITGFFDSTATRLGLVFSVIIAAVTVLAWIWPVVVRWF